MQWINEPTSFGCGTIITSGRPAFYPHGHHLTSRRLGTTLSVCSMARHIDFTHRISCANPTTTVCTHNSTWSSCARFCAQTAINSISAFDRTPLLLVFTSTTPSIIRLITCQVASILVSTAPIILLGTSHLMCMFAAAGGFGSRITHGSGGAGKRSAYGSYVNSIIS
jgi:hypothetical protein